MASLTDAETDANEAAYQRLLAQWNELKDSYDTAYAEAEALGMLAQYGSQFAGINQQIQAMKGMLETNYANNALNEDSTLGDNYSTIAGQVAQLRSTLEQTIMGQVSSIFSNSFGTINNGLGSAIGGLQTQLNTWGVADQFADRMEALTAKRNEASAKVAEYQTAVQAETDYVKKLSIAKETQEYVNNTSAEINAEIAAIQEEAEAAHEAKVAANQTAYERLTAELDELQASLDYAQKEVNALAAVLGGSFAGQYGYQIAMIQQSINAEKGALEQQYSAGSLTEESTLSNPQIAANISQIRSTLDQTIMGQVSNIFSNAFGTINNGLGSAIGGLQTQLNTWGVADQFADRMEALTAKRNEASAKVAEYQTAVQAETDYVKKLSIAKETQEYVNNTSAEINAEIAAIQEEAEAAHEAKVAANQTAYERLTAELDELQASLDYAQKEVNALAAVLGGSFAGQYGYQIAMIQQSINAEKGALEQQYSAGSLTEESTLSNPQIAANISQIRSTLDQTIMGQVSNIFSNAFGTINNGLGSAIGGLQTQLNTWGVADQFADRMEALTAKRNEASAKVQEYQTEVQTETDYIEKLNKAIEARDYVNEVTAEINAEIEAIRAEAQLIATGISSATYSESFANGQVYDMNGKRVTTPGKGMYIINGKKVFVKGKH